MLTRSSNVIKACQDYSHNDIRTRLKCPGCLSTAPSRRQVRVHKSVRALYFHIATQHKDEPWSRECKPLMKAIAAALEYGMICSE